MNLYGWVLAGIFAASAVTFFMLFFLTAPYGRYMRSGWGLALKPHLAWFVMESPAVIVVALAAIFGSYRNAMPLVFLFLWEFHYIYRAFVYPFLLHESGTRNFPVIIMVMAIVYNMANGYVNGFYLFDSGATYSVSWLTDPRFVGGVVLFFAGFTIHVRSDAILRSLRKPGERTYRIPYGGLYRFVSSPNYFGEILQWCGFAVATWSVAGLSFAVFTIANLLPRGIAHHQWYRQNFSEYPPERKAVIPFLW